MIKPKSVKTEADVKRDIVRDVRANGGYARRIEDQYGVGILDMILIPYGLPVFFAEVKLIRSLTFAPTERQQVELNRIKSASNAGNHAIPIVIGWKEGVYYFHKPAQTIHCNDCFSVTSSNMSFYNQLVQYYHSRRT